MLDALFNHRLDGKNFVAADGLEEVADSLGIGRRTVVSIYKKNKGDLKRLPKNKDEIHGQFIGHLPTLLELAKFKRSQRKK